MSASFHQFGDKRILVLYGGIGENTGREMATSIRATSRYDEVWLCSGGGYVNEGILIGESLSRAKATVRITQGYRCVSACTIAAMGGYARIIEPDGHFVIHASSRFSNFGYSVEKDNQGKAGLLFSRMILLDCESTAHQPACGRIRTSKLTDLACPRHEDLYKLNSSCAYFDTQSGNYRNDALDISSRFAFVLASDPELIDTVLRYHMQRGVEGEVQLLRYYQKMLLDGNTSLINNRTYNQLTMRFVPRSVFQLQPAQAYYRNLTSDAQSLTQARTLEKQFALWQLLLTDGELSVKEQLINYIRNQQIDLGVAGEAAVRIYDAMRTCQIQSLCELERHTAEALGYHNMYDYE